MNPLRQQHPAGSIPHYATWFVPAEELIPDGTSGGTFTDDLGTDGQQQYNALRFLGDSRHEAFYNRFLPEDFDPNGEFVADVIWSTDSTIAQTTAGTVAVWGGTVRFSPPGSHLPNASASVTSEGTALDVAGTAWTQVNWVNDSYQPSIQNKILTSRIDLTPSGTNPQPGDLMQFEIENRPDLYQKHANHIDVYGIRFRYGRAANPNG